MSSVHSTLIFVPDDEFVWLAAEIQHENSETGVTEVLIRDEAIPASKQQNISKSVSLRKYGLTTLPLQNPDMPQNGVNDMCTLAYLHEPSILDNLRRRFKGATPYTYTGTICVAVNPYQWLDIYNKELRKCYADGAWEDLPPHVYATSARAYNGLSTTGRNQSILVSGESGAGKTETVKILMGHCAFIASAEGNLTIDKLLKASPLLESFGNAKTARNDNSSRFGKFSQLEFDDNHRLVGSKCIHYLLEKSRVVSQSSLERNYHVIYQLLSAPEDVKSRLFLTNKNVHDFLYTSNGDCQLSVIEGVSDQERYHLTVSALDLLGVSEVLRKHIESALVGILYLGLVTFIEKTGNSDAVDLADTESSTEAVRACCELLGVEQSAFSQTTISRTLDVEGEKLKVPLNYDQASSGRDALAKEIYARVFQWLVMVINFNTSYQSNMTLQEPTNHNSSINSKHGIAGTISLLDIFGFECFAVNRFEQLCINFANEKLQQKFTEDVFKTVQTEYAREGLVWEHITFQDNADVLDLIEGKKGIIHHLNEECLLPKGSDASFLNKVKIANSSTPSFSSSQLNREVFTVQHYAGKVTYTITGFMDCNKDTLPEDMRLLLANSTNPLLRRIFSDTNYFGATARNSDELLSAERSAASAFLLLPYNGQDGLSLTVPRLPHLEGLEQQTQQHQHGGHGGSAASNASGAGGKVAVSRRRNSFMMAETVTTKFKTQLHTLMIMISSTEVQYVRCIKPNPNKSKAEFNRSMVVEQLRSAGMVEAIRIARSAYPNRLTYSEFLNRFRCLRSRAWFNARKREMQALHGMSLPMSPPQLQSQPLRRTVLFASLDEPNAERSSAAGTSTDNAVPFARGGDSSSNGSGADHNSSSSNVLRTPRRGSGGPGLTRTMSEDASQAFAAGLYAYIAKELIISAAKDDDCADITHSNITDYEPSEFMSLFQFGVSKIYFSSDLSDKLEAQRNSSLVKYAVTLQKQFRAYLGRKKFNSVRIKTVAIQKHVRRFFAVKRYNAIREKAIHIQANVRMKQAIRKVQRMREYRAATRIQSKFRRNKDRVWFKKQKAASIVISALIRMFVQRRKYIVLRDHARKMKDLYAKLAMFEDQLQTSANEINELKTENTVLKEQIENSKSEETEKLNKVKSEFAKEIALLKEQLQSSEENNRVLIMKCEATENQIEITEFSLAELKTKLDKETKLLRSTESKLEMALAENVAKESNILNATENLQKAFQVKEIEFENQIKDFQLKLEELTAFSSKQSDSINQVEREKEAISNELDVANKLLAEEAKKRIEIENDLNCAQSNTTQLVNQIAELQAEVQALKASNQQLSDSVSASAIQSNSEKEIEIATMNKLQMDMRSLQSKNEQLEQTNIAAIAEIDTLNRYLSEEKQRRVGVETELKAMLDSASVLANVVAAADAVEASKASNASSLHDDNDDDENGNETGANEREELLQRIALLEALVRESQINGASIPQTPHTVDGSAMLDADADEEDNDDSYQNDTSSFAIGSTGAYPEDQMIMSSSIDNAALAENRQQDAVAAAAAESEHAIAIEELKIRNSELANLLGRSVDERDKLVQQLQLVSEKLTTAAANGSPATNSTSQSNSIEVETMKLLLSAKDNEIQQLKQSIQQQQEQFQELQKQYAVVTRHGVDILSSSPIASTGRQLIDSSTADSQPQDSNQQQQLSTPRGITRKLSTSSKAFSFAPEILPIEGSIANMTCGKLVAQLYLSSKSGMIMEKTAVILRRHDSNSLLNKSNVIGGGLSSQTSILLEASAALSAPPETVIFECELTGTDNLVKRLRFRGSELRSVRRGKGKTMAISQMDKLCLHIIIEGKGELNLSLPSEQERDASIKFFKLGMMSSTNAGVDSAPNTPSDFGTPMSNRTPSSVSSISPRTPYSVNGPYAISAKGVHPVGSSKYFANSTPTSSPALIGRQPAATSLSSLFNSSVEQQPQPRVSSELSHSVNSHVLHQGWVVREEAREGSIYKPWIRQYLVLDKDVASKSFYLKYAATQAVVEFPSQLKGSLRLTKDLKVVISGDGTVTSHAHDASENSNHSGNQPGSHVEHKNWMIQVQDMRGVSKLSILLESQTEQMKWSEFINDAIAESV